MGKKRSRKSYTSKGQRRNVATKNKFDVFSVIDRLLFKAKALNAKKRVYQTIPNPDKSNTKERFIRVLMNG